MHQCAADSLDLDGVCADFALAFWVVHEVPDPAKLFREIALLLKPGGTLFYTEPPFIVSGKEFRKKLALAEEAGFRQVDRSHRVILVQVENEIGIFGDSRDRSPLANQAFAAPVPAEMTGRMGKPAHCGNCSDSSRLTSAASVSTSSACILTADTSSFAGGLRGSA